MWWEVVFAVGGGILLLWLTLVALLFWGVRKQPNSTITLGDALRLVPDVVRLLCRLVADPLVSRRIRVGLVVLLVYLVSPIDLIPDFIPVVGWADDAIIVLVVLRFVVRHAGAAALDRHWGGTPQGLAAMRTLAGIGGAPNP